MNNKWLKPPRPASESILCNYTACAHGLGQAGNGRCPGDWARKDCPEFITQEDLEKEVLGSNLKIQVPIIFLSPFVRAIYEKKCKGKIFDPLKGCTIIESPDMPETEDCDE